jgi:hypothetical protein
MVEAFASLADIAPPGFTFLSEESDWGLVGGDLRDAMDSAQSRIAEPHVENHEALVEA